VGMFIVFSPKEENQGKNFPTAVSLLNILNKQDAFFSKNMPNIFYFA